LISDEIKLDPHTVTLNFLREILNIKYIENHLSFLGCDITQLKLKRLKKSDIIPAYNILKLIEESIDRNMKNDLWMLSSNFYNIIPFDFSYK
jgi:hypothetical protein